MLAVSPNVVVRFLTRDDAAQFARADALIRDEDIFISATVLLETEWVLRSAYGYARTRIIAALRDLAGLPRVTVEDPDAIETAFAWMAAGIDFADALHLATTRHCEAFVTFDRPLVAAARRVGGPLVRAP